MQLEEIVDAAKEPTTPRFPSSKGLLPLSEEFTKPTMMHNLSAMPQIKDDHDADALRSGRRGRTFESCRPDFEELCVGHPLVLRGLPNDQYHSLPVPSKSPLWAYRKHGPVWYYEQFVARSHPPFASDSLARGTLVHLVFELGEPEFRRRAVLVPERFCTASGTLSAGKESKAWLADQPKDAILLTPADDAVITGLWKQAQDNAAVREIIDSISEHELSVIWEREDGHRLRCRFDAVTHDGRLIDWKTTREARPLESWIGPAIDHGYHYQAALYGGGAIEAGISDRPMTFVVLSTTPSYQVQAVTLPANVVDMCHDMITRDLDEIALRTETDNWLCDGYGEVHELVVPDYLLRRHHA